MSKAQQLNLVTFHLTAGDHDIDAAWPRVAARGRRTGKVKK